MENLDTAALVADRVYAFMFALTHHKTRGSTASGVVPTALTAGARLAPGNTGAVAGGLLAAVYLSFMICPPLIGWLGEVFSLQAALTIIGLSGVGIAWLARSVDGSSQET